MSDTVTVFESLQRVMLDLRAVGKDSTNEQQRFKFRGIDAVMNAAHPLFAEHGVLCVPMVLERLSESRETKSGGTMNVVHLLVRYRFYGPSGDFIDAEVWGEAQDSADKATNKALSAAFKYALFQTLCIPTEDQPDADSTTVEAGRPKNRSGLPTNRDGSVSRSQITEEQKTEHGLMTKEAQKEHNELVKMPTGDKKAERSSPESPPEDPWADQPAGELPLPEIEAVKWVQWWTQKVVDATNVDDLIVLQDKLADARRADRISSRKNGELELLAAQKTTELMLGAKVDKT